MGGGGSTFKFEDNPTRLTEVGSMSKNKDLTLTFKWSELACLFQRFVFFDFSVFDYHFCQNRIVQKKTNKTLSFMPIFDPTFGTHQAER